MTKINNVVRVIEFKDDIDLYHKIDKFMSYKAGEALSHMRVENINLIDNNHALVYIETDFSVVQVKFYVNGKLYEFENAPCNDKFMSYEELKMIDSLGEINIEEKLYDVDLIEYCVDSVGISYVKINLK